jgi:hypothetical protein
MYKRATSMGNREAADILVISGWADDEESGSGIFGDRPSVDTDASSLSR